MVAKNPQRRSIVTGEIRPRGDLLRFVASPDGIVTPDLAARLPGRGLWVEPRRELIEQACTRNLFARAARRPARPPDGLVNLVATLLLKSCLDLLRLARRARRVEVGYDQVAPQLGAAGGTGPRPAVLVTAFDGSSRARNQADRLCARDDRAVTRVTCLSAAELGSPFDRDRVVHLLLPAGRLADRFLLEATRLAGVRPVPATTNSEEKDGKHE